MPIENLIYSRLAATTALTDLVSTRIYPLVRPQDSTGSAVVYWRVSNPILFSMSTGDEISSPRFQFDCYATTFSAVRAIARRVKESIDRWGTSTGTPVVIKADVVNEMDDYDPELNEYQSIVEAIIQHANT